MKTKHKKKPEEHTSIAKERIARLFSEAEDAEQELADRYVKIARDISMKYKVRIPSDLKKRFCKKCNTYMIPGENCIVRTRQGRLVYHCQKCGNMMRFVVRKGKRGKRAT